MEERNALVFSQDSRWITTLYAAFQDEENLYLVMEYASGGSLRNLMNNRESIMSEEEARFYVAEILMSLDELHRLHYIHRFVTKFSETPFLPSILMKRSNTGI
jgi:serine/threonine protein kinase